MKIFTYEDHTLKLNMEEIMLIPEFKALTELKRNKCDEDKGGRKRLVAWREFEFIYLYLDHNSPYASYDKRDRLRDSLATSKIKSYAHLKEVMDLYEEFQTTKTVKLLNSAYGAVDKLRDYFDELDLTETDPETGKPLYSARDVISNISNLGKLVNGLQELEDRVKREKSAKTNLRGDQQEGLLD